MNSAVIKFNGFAHRSLDVTEADFQSKLEHLCVVLSFILIFGLKLNWNTGLIYVANPDVCK